MAIKRLVTPERFVGLSTDTKPTDGATSVRPGATFYEYDTNILQITYDGTTWAKKTESTTTKVSLTTKALEAAVAYTAGDVLSESDTNTVGTDWDFTAVANRNAGSGIIKKAMVISETTAITPRLTLFLFNAAPTCELDDNAANTALLHADLSKFVGSIDFPAMEDVGTGDSQSIATPSTVGNLPLAYTCATGADDLFGVLVTRTAFTQTATHDMTVVLEVEME